MTARRGSSSWFGAQQNALWNLRHGASHVVRPHAAARAGSVERWHTGVPAAGSAARSVSAVRHREARAAGGPVPASAAEGLSTPSRLIEVEEQ
jgi:hypothetical protein